jgi:hypothetical protein
MGRRAKKKPLRRRIVPKPDTHVKQKRARKHNKQGKWERCCATATCVAMSLGIAAGVGSGVIRRPLARWDGLFRSGWLGVGIDREHERSSMPASKIPQ